MKQKILFAIIATLLLVACTNTNGNKVVEFPSVGSANTTMLTFEKVELTDTATVLTMRACYRPHYWIKMSEAPYLVAQDKRYKLLDCKDFELGKEIFMPEDGDSCFTLFFEPLPKDCKQFDFIKGTNDDEWKIYGIDLTGKLRTYWRNEATGEWLIAFTDKHIVYDCAVWDIITAEERGDKYSFTAQRGDEKISVKVGKERRGTRKISVNGASAVKCTAITSRALPDYPVKDERAAIKDNNYQMGDSVTIVGWLKNMPDKEWKKGKEFSINKENIFTLGCFDEEVYSAPMDSLGRFTLKIPLINSSQVFIDWSRCNVSSMLEPGATYFFMYDFTTGQRLFMGDDARLQNELLAHPKKTMYERIKQKNATAEQAMDFMRKVKEVYDSLLTDLDAIVATHPNLSQRYINYLKGYYLSGAGESLMQAKFYVADRTFPAEYVAYVDTLWNKMVVQTPYTLYSRYTTFLSDYIDYKKDHMEGEKNSIATTIKKVVNDGKITLSKKELDIVNRYDEELERIKKLISNLSEKQAEKVVDKFNSEYGRIISDIWLRNNEIMQVEGICNFSARAISSVPTTQTLKDIYMAGTIWGYIDGLRTPVNAQIMEWAEKNIQLPVALNMVTEIQNKYLALTGALNNNSSIKSADDVKNMSDGEKILRKLTEPYRGKYILVDVWGTWCSPCKAALAKSKKLFERMAPYNMVFLYLANRSSDESWKNVIKEYNVVGENIVHYNLPSEQQAAVENYLRVASYPTYRLISPEGSLLDVNADPRDIDTFEKMIKDMKK
ncbi:MAG: redoxin domain-containing protein [Bacteroidaceae bacterium]|nr:redoxin domain-containing protein [Bacteroidaceae bacterium]